MRIRGPDVNCEERLLTRTRIRMVTLFEMINKNVPPLLATLRQALFRSLELIAREHREAGTLRTSQSRYPRCPSQDGLDNYT